MGLFNIKYLLVSIDLFYYDIYLYERYSKCELFLIFGYFCLMIFFLFRLGRDFYNDEFFMFING